MLSEQGYKFHVQSIFVYSQGANGTGLMYNLVSRQMRNKTIDEKCQNGLFFGVGFQWYSPYVVLGHTGT